MKSVGAPVLLHKQRGGSGGGAKGQVLEKTHGQEARSEAMDAVAAPAQSSIFEPSSTTALFGRFRKSAAPLAA